MDSPTLPAGEPAVGTAPDVPRGPDPNPAHLLVRPVTSAPPAAGSGNAARRGASQAGAWRRGRIPDNRDLRVYRLSGGTYEHRGSLRFPELGLGMMLWEGEFEDARGPWLRWTDESGVLIPTGNEKAEQASRRAEQERRRADRLEALLLQAGIDPKHG